MDELFLYCSSTTITAGAMLSKALAFGGGREGVAVGLPARQSAVYFLHVAVALPKLGAAGSTTMPMEGEDAPGIREVLRDATDR